MAGKNLGDLFVTLSARTAGFAEQLGKAMDSGIQKVAAGAKKMEESVGKVAEGVSRFATPFLAVTGAVTAVTATSVGLVYEMDRVKGAFTVLIDVVSQTFRPLLNDVIRLVRGATSAWQSLTPATKAHIVEAVRWSVVLGAGLTVLGRTLGMLKAALGVFSVLGPVLGGAAKAWGALSAMMIETSTAAVAAGAATEAAGAAAAASAGGMSFAGLASGAVGMLAPVLAIAAAMAGVVLLAGALYKNWSMVSDAIHAALDATVLYTTKGVDVLVRMFVAVWQGLQGLFVASSGAMIEAMLGNVKLMARMMLPLAQALKFTKVDNVLSAIAMTSGEDIARGMMDGALKSGTALVNFAKDAASTIAEGVVYGSKVSGGLLVDSLKDAASGAKMMLGDLTDSVSAWAKGFMPDFSGNGVGTVAQFEPGHEPKAAGPMELPDSIRALSSGKDPIQAAEWKRHADMLKALSDAAKDAAASLKDKFSAALGQLPGIVETFKHGVAATGGVRTVTGSNGQQVQEAVGGSLLGGVGAVALQLLMQSKQFAKVMEVVNGVIQVLADFLGQLLEPLGPLIGALGVIVTALLPALQPVIDILVEVIKMLTPPLMMLGQLLQALAPILQLAMEGLKLITEPMRILGGVVLKALFEVLRFVGIVVLTVVKALADAFNAIAKVINGFIDKAKEIYKQIYGPFMGGNGDLIDKVYGGLHLPTINTDGLQSSLDGLKNATWSSSMDAAAAAAERFRQSTDKASESLTNVPNAWKIALRRQQTQDAQDGANGGGNGAHGSGPESGGAAGGWDNAIAHVGHQHGASAASPDSNTVSAGDPTAKLLRESQLAAQYATQGGDTYNLYGTDVDELLEAAERNRQRKGKTGTMRDGGNGTSSLNKFSAVPA